MVWSRRSSSQPERVSGAGVRAGLSCPQISPYPQIILTPFSPAAPDPHTSVVTQRGGPVSSAVVTSGPQDRQAQGVGTVTVRALQTGNPGREVRWFVQSWGVGPDGLTPEPSL